MGIGGIGTTDITTDRIMAMGTVDTTHRPYYGYGYYRPYYGYGYRRHYYRRWW